MDAFVSQGELIEFADSRRCALVLSRDLFNSTGLSVLCPVVPQAEEDALHIPVRTENILGVALCEHLKTLDLRARHYRNRGSIDYSQIQNIVDAVQAIFDYYPFGKTN